MHLALEDALCKQFARAGSCEWQRVVEEEVRQMAGGRSNAGSVAMGRTERNAPAAKAAADPDALRARHLADERSTSRGRWQEARLAALD